MADSSEMRNVGSKSQPVSFLNQRAVALLYDELTRPRRGDEGNELRVRLKPGDTQLSDDLRAGVASVRVPSEWDSVGGLVPDLILYDAEGNPTRIIEVIVTSRPDKAKSRKLDTIRSRGVDVVELEVYSEKDLLTLCFAPVKPSFNSLTLHESRREEIPLRYDSHVVRREDQREHDELVRRLALSIRRCSPSLRRELLNVFRNLNTLDSLFPLRSNNPLKEQLEEPTEANGDSR